MTEAQQIDPRAVRVVDSVSNMLNEYADMIDRGEIEDIGAAKILRIIVATLNGILIERTP